MFAFSGVQFSFLSFYVTYLTKGLGLGLGSAGAVLAASQAVAMVSRVLWGWIATGRVRPRLVLAMLAFGMVLSAILAGVSRPEWPLVALLAVALMFGTTATGWNGVMLAEITRASPAGRVGEMTGGALFFGFAGSMSVPAVFGGLLDATEGDYAVCFGMVAVIAVVAGVLFLFSAGAGRPRSDVPAKGPRPVN
jgi:fucose permease